MQDSNGVQARCLTVVETVMVNSFIEDPRDNGSQQLQSARDLLTRIAGSYKVCLLQTSEGRSR